MHVSILFLQDSKFPWIYPEPYILCLPFELFSRSRWRLVSIPSYNFGYCSTKNCLYYFGIYSTQQLTTWTDMSLHRLLLMGSVAYPLPLFCHHWLFFVIPFFKYSFEVAIRVRNVQVSVKNLNLRNDNYSDDGRRRPVFQPKFCCNEKRDLKWPASTCPVNLRCFNILLSQQSTFPLLG